MHLLQRWRRKREVKKAIAKYNSALESLAEAAELIQLVAVDTDCLTAGIETAVEQMRVIAKEATINLDDFGNGGNTDGKTRQRS